MRRFAVSLLGALVGCSAKDFDVGDPNAGRDSHLSVDAGGEAALESGSEDVAADTSGSSDSEPFDAPLDTAPPIPEDTSVYAHSDARLYRLDAKTYVLTEIGEFQVPGGTKLIGITDIALDKDAKMYGISFGNLYAIDYAAPGGPMCKELATLSGEFNGLTFVPAGTIDPSKEVLIGAALDGGWWRIDVTKGATAATTTKLGSYGGGLASSGDVVGIIGDKVYATVEGTSGPGDHVIVVDPKTGAKLKDLGDTGVPGLWGVAYWGGTMFGFKSDGRLFKIDLATAKATEIPLKIKPDNGFWGAGVRTSAPNTPPK